MGNIWVASSSSLPSLGIGSYRAFASRKLQFRHRPNPSHRSEKNIHAKPTRPAALFSRRKVGRGASAQSPTNPPRVPSAIATRYPITLRPRITVALWPTLAAVDLALIVSTKIQSFVTREGVIVIAI